VEHTAAYTLHDVVLQVGSDDRLGEDVHRVLDELSWTRVTQPTRTPTLHLSARAHEGRGDTPAACREVLRTDEFRGFEGGDDFFLTDRSSVFHLEPQAARAHAWIAADFFQKPSRTQANFWCFGLMKLLRPLRLYSLHAAALASDDGQGLLLVGPSGSGKSTLAIGLIRAGWRYLSDDAVLLRNACDRVEATACRKSFYIDAVRSADYADCGLDEREPDSSGAERIRLRLHETYGGQHAAQCVPRAVVFPRITGLPRSALRPIARLDALRLLLAQSAPQLFDLRTMPSHLGTLKKLLDQVDTFELDAGGDLYREPAKLVELLSKARGAIT
jgi:hypothetical protein